MANHTAAIHVLKSKLQLTDDDYRALLRNLTHKTSSKDLSDKERQAVRDHMQNLAERAGVAKPLRRRATARTFAQAKAAASSRERKVWALWNQLHRDGLVHDTSAAALNAAAAPVLAPNRPMGRCFKRASRRTASIRAAGPQT